MCNNRPLFVELGYVRTTNRELKLAKVEIGHDLFVSRTNQSIMSLQSEYQDDYVDCPGRGIHNSSETTVMAPSLPSIPEERRYCRRRIRRRPLKHSSSLLILVTVYHCCSALSITSSLKSIIPSSLFSNSSRKRSYRTPSELRNTSPTVSRANGDVEHVRVRSTSNQGSQQHPLRQRSMNNRLFVSSPLFATPNPYTNTITSTRRNSNQNQWRKSLFRTRPKHASPTSTINNPASSPSSSTSLNMVLTTPESIIEQASTMKLLDDLIDESVRTAARRPFILQFDPSSGYVSQNSDLVAFLFCTLNHVSTSSTILSNTCVNPYSFGGNGKELYFRSHGNQPYGT